MAETLLCGHSSAFFAPLRFHRTVPYGIVTAQPCERTDARQGHANGFKPKTVATRMGAITFAIPQVRGGVDFYPSALDQGVRREQALKLALAEMDAQGVSTRQVPTVLAQLCGLEISSTPVSQCAARLDTERAAWRTRPLSTCPDVILDARHEKGRQAGQLLDCAALIALGITPAGQRTLLGVSVAPGEAETHGRTFLLSRQQRGRGGVQLLVSDDHAGLGAARAAVFSSVPWQRGQFHLQQNAPAYVPRLDERAAVATAIRSVFDGPDRARAARRLQDVVSPYAPRAPKLAAWREENLPQGLTVLRLSVAHPKRWRTPNGLERVNPEIKRRPRVARMFPNEASLLRLVSARLAETSDDWASEKLYLNMNPPTQPSV